MIEKPKKEKKTAADVPQVSMGSWRADAALQSILAQVQAAYPEKRLRWLSLIGDDGNPRTFVDGMDAARKWRIVERKEGVVESTEYFGSVGSFSKQAMSNVYTTHNCILAEMPQEMYEDRTKFIDARWKAKLLAATKGKPQVDPAVGNNFVSKEQIEEDLGRY